MAEQQSALEAARQERPTPASQQAVPMSYQDAEMLSRCLKPALLDATPSLPQGSRLQLDLLSTWGDPNYIGLSGIEICDDIGDVVKIVAPKRQARASPSGVHELPGLQDDPRTVDNLFDGVHDTSDALHMWLAPFTPGRPHTVEVDMEAKASFTPPDGHHPTSTANATPTIIRTPTDTYSQPSPPQVSVSRLRFWNYNASRAHAQRGARHLEIRLDGALIFSGELACAVGSNRRGERSVTTVMFSDEPRVLELLAERDEGEAQVDTTERGAKQELEQSLDWSLTRPSTASGLASSASAAMVPPAYTDAPAPFFAGHASATPRGGYAPSPPPPVHVPAGILPLGWHTVASVIHCTILSTWGDQHYFGLAGLQVVDDAGKPLPLAASQLRASPSDLNEMGGNQAGDPRTLDKLLDPKNNTTDSWHMWLAPWQPQENSKHTLTIDLGQPTRVSALRLWNYNKSEDDSYRGCSHRHLPPIHPVISLSAGP